MTDQEEIYPDYKQLRFWLDNYARGDMPDQRGIGDFMELEQGEVISSLRGELIALSKGRYREENMMQILGKKRIVKYGSFEGWAKLMLLWMAGHRG